uniref:Integrase, catalytic region, zinc finger, CCHC-type, peptidase aspartic, catalytic n=1 Tax=Tanacetum cinerariifolium TaxID=118510 RepID=A0A6L2JPE3_TANCI|nr:integrase, catalytic region, zinc finger, CCHC-type, peptidase aspartic, catalytic [Tanacetum cinerariifolium]
MAGLLFRMFSVDRTEVRGTMQAEQVPHSKELHKPKQPQNLEYFKDKMLLMQAQEYEANECDAFDLDVDEAPTAQSMFMANLSFADPVYDEAGPSYDSDTLSEVYDHDNYQDVVCEHHEDNAELVVQNNVSSLPNDASMMIVNEMHEQTAQCVSVKAHTKVVDASLTVELAIYKEQVKLYERRAKTLKKGTSFCKMKLNSTINHNKSMVEEVTYLKKDFKQKENKYLEEFLDMKALKEKVKDKLLKQDQSLQTVHMLCKPKPYYDDQRKVAIGYKNPLCLTRAKQLMPLCNLLLLMLTNRNPIKIGDPTFQTLHLRLFSNAGRTDFPLVFGLRLLTWLRNFVKKFIETVRFGNDYFGAIMGYRDYVIGDSVISRVYYMEGLGHNLLSVGQFCYSDLKVAFRKSSCYVRDTNSIEIIKSSRGSNLYTISVEDMLKSSPICLLSKAFKNKSWLWHRRLNHLNFDTINDLSRKYLVKGLTRLKFKKDHLLSVSTRKKQKA